MIKYLIYAWTQRKSLITPRSVQHTHITDSYVHKDNRLQIIFWLMQVLQAYCWRKRLLVQIYQLPSPVSFRNKMDDVLLLTDLNASAASVARFPQPAVSCCKCASMSSRFWVASPAKHAAYLFACTFGVFHYLSWVMLNGSKWSGEMWRNDDPIEE